MLPAISATWAGLWVRAFRAYGDQAIQRPVFDLQSMRRDFRCRAALIRHLAFFPVLLRHCATPPPPPPEFRDVFSNAPSLI
jgi:hypothetical protein